MIITQVLTELMIVNNNGLMIVCKTGFGLINIAGFAGLIKINIK